MKAPQVTRYAKSTQLSISVPGRHDILCIYVGMYGDDATSFSYYRYNRATINCSWEFMLDLNLHLNGVLQIAIG